MLRKRSRPFQKEHSRGQLMAELSSDSSVTSESLVQKARNSAFFSVPGLFVGFTTKGVSESDSVRSPTSPLDFKVFASLRSPRSPGLGSWNCNKVGLGLVDSLNDETVLGSSESKNILFGSQISSQTHATSPKFTIGSVCNELEPGEFGKIQSRSLDIGDIGGGSSLPLNRLMYRNPKPNSDVFSSDSKNTILGSLPLVQGGIKVEEKSSSLPITIGLANGFMGSLSTEIELSEDYTCIISHGPNPKTTHIFGDCILETCTIQSLDYKNKIGNNLPLPSDDFLSYCFACKKKLEEGKDIHMYGGDKAFCSFDCRDQEILSDEETEKPTADSSTDCLSSSFSEDIFMSGMAMGP